MYGSVSAGDIAALLQERGLPVDRKNVMLTKPIKETGLKEVVIKLKEGISIVTKLTIIPEGINVAGLENVVKPIPAETAPEAPSA